MKTYVMSYHTSDKLDGIGMYSIDDPKIVGRTVVKGKYTPIKNGPKVDHKGCFSGENGENYLIFKDNGAIRERDRKHLL